MASNKLLCEVLTLVSQAYCKCVGLCLFSSDRNKNVPGQAILPILTAVLAMISITQHRPVRLQAVHIRVGDKVC